MMDKSIKTVSFLFGAGASARLNYPTVIEFFSRCKGESFESFPNVQLGEVWAAIRARDYPGSRTPTYPDINAEVLFGVVRQMQEMQSLGLGPNKSARQLYGQLCHAIMEIYGKDPDIKPAECDPLWGLIKLADDLLPKSEPLYLFTTNYDKVVEYSLRRWMVEPGGTFGNIHLRTGFSQDPPNRFDGNIFEAPPKPNERAVNLIKLHGSATWKRETSSPNSPVIETNFGGPTDRDCVLYFGYKQIPEVDPFLTLHRLFKKALLRPSILVSIGFQFADPYLHELVDFALDANSGLKVICCLKEEPEENSQVHKLVERHGKQFGLLRDTAGKPVALGDGFCEILQASIQVMISLP